MNFLIEIMYFYVMIFLLFILLTRLEEMRFRIIILRISNAAIKGLFFMNIMLVVFFLLISIISLSFFKRFHIWYIVCPFVTLSILLFSVIMSSSNDIIKFVISFETYAVVLTIPLLSLGLIGFVPFVNDEGRYVGFSFRIISYGKWIPYTYPETEYYQLFHVVPCLKAVASLITGLDVLSPIHIILVIDQAIIMILSLTSVCRTLLNCEDKVADTLAKFMIFTTPGLSILSFIPRTLSFTYFTITLLVVIRGLLREKSAGSLILISILTLISIITHPIYFVLNIFFLMSVEALFLAVKGRINAKGDIIFITHTLLITVLISLLWMSVMTLHELIITGEQIYHALNAMLLKVLFPENIKIKTYGLRTPWYLKAPFYWALPWSYLPAVASVYLFSSEGLAGIFKRSLSKTNAILLASNITGMILIATGYMIRYVSTMTSYIYYALILLVPPVVILTHKQLLRKSLSSIIIMSLIAITFGIALQDYAYSPDYSKLIPTPTITGWKIAKSIEPLLTGEYTKLATREIRLGLNAYILRNNPKLFEFYTHRIMSSNKLIIIKKSQRYKAPIYSDLVFNYMKYIIYLLRIP